MKIFACFALQLFWGGLQAHDLYLLPAKFHIEKGTTLRVAFHNGDAFPASEVAPKVARLLEPSITGAVGTVAIQSLKVQGKETLGEAKVNAVGTLIVSVRTAPNLIELEPKKFEEYLKEESLDHVLAWRKEHGETVRPGRERYSKYAKSLVQSGASDAFFQHRMNFPIEIVPLSDPYAVKPGSRLPVQVFFRGKPARGMQIEAAWADGANSKTALAGRTDQDGRINVAIPQKGLWRLHTLKMERCTDSKAADWESFWASLTFEIR